MEKTQHAGRMKAWMITGILILVASCFGVARSMASLRHDAEQYYMGEQSITADLDTKTGYTHNMITIADKYLNKNESEPLRQAIAGMAAAKTPSAKYQANLRIDAEVAALSEKLRVPGAAVKETDLAYLQKILTDTAALNDIIGRNEYNARAIAYNNQLKELPVRLLKGPLLISELELYGE